MTNPVTAWSYSRYACYQTCPLQFKLRYIDKVPEPSSPAMERGNKVHQALARYLTKQDDAPPPEGEKFAGLLAQLREMPDKVVEQQWAFTAKWQKTGWFSKGTKATWLRVILDVGVIYEDATADVIDHKTGKKYGTNDDQMELFGLATMCHFPHLERVTTRLWYHDIGDEEVAEFCAADKEHLKNKWRQNVTPMLNDVTFAPRPNDKCKFCAFSASKSGICKFG